MTYEEKEKFRRRRKEKEKERFNKHPRQDQSVKEYKKLKAKLEEPDNDL